MDRIQLEKNRGSGGKERENARIIVVLNLFRSHRFSCRQFYRKSIKKGDMRLFVGRIVDCDWRVELGWIEHSW